MIDKITTVTSGSDALKELMVAVGEDGTYETPTVVLRGDDVEYEYKIASGVEIEEEEEVITLGVFKSDYNRKLTSTQFWDNPRGMRKVLKDRVFASTRLSFDAVLQGKNYPHPTTGKLDAVLTYGDTSVVLHNTVLEEITIGIDEAEAVMEIGLWSLEQIQHEST